MGRHYKIPKFTGYISKNRGNQLEEEARLRRMQSYSPFERQVCAFLHRYAIDILESAGQGTTRSEAKYMKELVRMFNADSS